jgi:hypothetical protein
MTVEPQHASNGSGPKRARLVDTAQVEVSAAKSRVRGLYEAVRTHILAPGIEELRRLWATRRAQLTRREGSTKQDAEPGLDASKPAVQESEHN